MTPYCFKGPRITVHFLSSYVMMCMFLLSSELVLHESESCQMFTKKTLPRHNYGTERWILLLLNSRLLTTCLAEQAVAINRSCRRAVTNLPQSSQQGTNKMSLISTSTSEKKTSTSFDCVDNFKWGKLTIWLFPSKFADYQSGTSLTLCKVKSNLSLICLFSSS